jgi:hypothetical protein
MKAQAASPEKSSSFPPPLVPEVLQYRLDTGNIGKSGGQRGSLTRCAQKYGTFRSKLLHDKDAQAIETSKGELVQELQLFQLELVKLNLQQQILAAQVEENNTTQAEREARIEEEKSRVKEIQAKAQRAQETRNCWLEYEALAKLAQEKCSQPRRKLEQQIEQVKKELQDLKDQQESVNEVLQVRESQFQLLLQYMLDLKRSLNDEEGEEEQEPLPSTKKQKKNEDEEGAVEEQDEGVEMDVDGEEQEEEEGLYGDL